MFGGGMVAENSKFQAKASEKSARNSVRIYDMYTVLAVLLRISVYTVPAYVLREKS